MLYGVVSSVVRISIVLIMIGGAREAKAQSYDCFDLELARSDWSAAQFAQANYWDWAERNAIELEYESCSRMYTEPFELRECENRRDDALSILEGTVNELQAAVDAAAYRYQDISSQLANEGIICN